MKLAMVLPMFSEYPLKEHLGIELIVKSLRENNYQVDCIDLNENLVDYMLTNKAILQRMFFSEEKNAKTQESPYTKYLEHYLNYLLKHDTARLLKKKGLYDTFFRTIVLNHFDPGIFPDDSLAQKYQSIIDSVPVINEFLTIFAETCIKNKYDTLLVSVPHAHQFIYALLFSQKIKTANGDVKIIFGGTTVTLSEDKVLNHYMENGFLDYYIKYSGEEKLLSLLVDLESDEEIDQAALAQREYVDINDQTVMYRPEFDKSSVPVLFSRGCYWGKCSYCTYICLDTGKFERKKQEVLISELAQFSGNPVRVSLITESLTPHDAKIIAEGILENNLKIRWGSFIRVNQKFDADLFSLLRKSGCIYSCVGVESVNDKILAFLNKGYTKEDVYAFFRSAREAKFQFFQVNFMYGAPVADINDELDNIAFVSDFRDIIGNIAFFRLEITKKSYLGQHLEELGIQIDRSSSRRAIRVDNIPFLPSLSEKELMLIERSYGIAGDYFKIRDVKSGVRLFLKQNPKAIQLKDVLLFELDGNCYAGSLKNLLVREMPPYLFAEMKQDSEIRLQGLDKRELFVLFELGVIDTGEIIYDSLKNSV
ncbi:MAG: radical SAM protein [Deltaproteobacteria bacterium]|nr:radical SAM protein [Deltaproteobacteria bacterium]